MTEIGLLGFLGQLPDNDVNLSDVADQMRSGTGVIPFVGAGLSVPYKFPQWGAFIRDLAQRAGVLDQVEAHLKTLEYEEAAELLQKRMHSRFQDLVEHYFGDRILEGAEFRGAVALVPHITTGPVITTNFDRLLEHVFEDAGYPFPVRVWHDKVHAVIRSVTRNRLTLLKLHGDWEFPSERVLTLSEYRKHYGNSRTKINFRLAIPQMLELLVTRPLLFLGCSLKQDRTGQIITQLAARMPTVRHYALLEYPETEASYAQRIDELARMNVRPVWYPQKQHEKIEQVLAYLAELLPEPLRLVKRKQAEVIRLDTIPRPESTFIGRGREQADLRARILKYRLVTVAGAPGTGKTRLTIQVARSLQTEFDAIWFVSLSQLSDGAALPQRIAHVMQLKGQSGKDLIDVVAAFLKHGRQLLVLDNCETALDECAAMVRKLLGECLDLHLVLTSRIDLGSAVEIGTEHVYRVPPLELPDPDHLPDLIAFALIESVELLLERVQAHSDTFRLTEANARKVAKLCRDLDGIPLAEELVAAQMDILSLDSVLELWDERLDFASAVSVGQPELQLATLRNTISLSYDLLGREQNGQRLRTLFRRLSVFHRGWTREAALAVCGEPGEAEKDMRELLKPLRRASLIEVEEVAGEKRYRYLDAIREFAFGELTRDGEDEPFSVRHAGWAADFAERWAPDLLTDRQAISLAKLIGEADNLRGAILWAQRRQDAATALRLTSALWRLMEIKGFYREGSARLRMALELPGTENLTILRSKALSGLSILAYRQGDLETSERCSLESLELERKYGTNAGVANALNDLGNVAQLRGEYQKALDFYIESLRIERERKNDRGIAVALYNCGRQAMILGQLDEGGTNMQASLKMFDNAGNRREAAFALNSLGQLARLRGQDEVALRYADRSLAIRQELEDQRGVAETMRTKAGVLIGKRDFASALELLGKSGDIAILIGDDRGVVETLEHLAWLTNEQDLLGHSACLYAAAEELRNKLGLPLPPVEQPARDSRLNYARKALGEQAFAAQWEKGRCTAPEEVFALGVNRKMQVVQAKHE
jgi:predicted ATPase